MNVCMPSSYLHSFVAFREYGPLAGAQAEQYLARHFLYLVSKNPLPEQSRTFFFFRILRFTRSTLLENARFGLRTLYACVVKTGKSSNDKIIVFTDFIILIL